MPAGRFATRPVTLNHVLRPQRFALVDNRGRRVGRIEHDLGDAIAVAQIDEQPAAVVAVAIDPAAKRDLRGRRGPVAIRRRYEFAARYSS